MIIVKFRLAGNMIKKNQIKNKKWPMIIASYELTYNKKIKELSSLTFFLITNTVIKSVRAPL